MENKIVICGNYGATNLGDEVILDGILNLIKRSLPSSSVTVLSSNPEETKTMHGVESEYLFPAGIRSLSKGIISGTIGKTLNAIRDADLFILGGGGLFTDEKPMAIVIWSLQSRIATFYNVPIFCFGQSVGPLRTFFGRDMTGRAFKRASAVTVRDHSSNDLLYKLGVSGVVELSDPGFVISAPEPIRILEDVEKYVVMSVRPWIRGDNSTILARFIDYLWSKHGLKTVLVPFQIVGDNDVTEIKKILDKVKNVEQKNGTKILADKPAELFSYTSDYVKIMELMNRSTAVIGMRLHSLILSSLVHTPFLALSYSDKVKQFAQQMDMSEYVLDWDGLKYESLVERIESLLEKHDELSEIIDNGVIVQRAKCFKHEEILSQFTE